VLVLVALVSNCGAFSPLSSVRSVHSELTDDKSCAVGGMSTRVAAAAPKAVRKVIPAPRAHWVGNAFYVYPVFGSMAFTEEVSPW